MKITVLGARGSMPVTGSEYLTYGGDTTSYLLETETQAIFLDAGTGIVHAPFTKKEVSVLISHPHLDHLMGIPFFCPFYEKDRNVNIYGVSRNGLTIREQLEHLMAPPLWPVGLDVFSADIRCNEISGSFRVGEAQIEIFENRHPGGCTAFRVISEGKTIVFSGDYEHDNGAGDWAFSRFAHDADLLIYDAHYTETEYKIKKSFGHSTPAKGLKIMNEAGAKRILFTHHDPFHKDIFLDAAEKDVKAICKSASFAREGEVIAL